MSQGLFNPFFQNGAPWMGGGSTPSAFSDVWGWWRADTISGTSGSYVLADKSVNGRNMTQAGGTITPGTAANGQARLTGNATARFTSAATIESWPITIITVGRRTAAATCGFFGHTGASPFNSLWTGYETTDRMAVYNTNANLNTTADGGADSCWTYKIGYGHRVSMLNNIIQPINLLSTQVRSAAITVSIGTEYRGLNLGWQETLVWNRVLSLSELDEVHAYINTRYTMSIPMWSSYTPTPTIWMGGQSNCAGRGDRGASDVNVPAEYDAALTGVNIWYGVPVNNIGTAFQTLNINENNHMLGDTQAATYIGHETALGKEYIDRVGGSVYICKYALGSTNLAVAPLPGFWHPTNNSIVQNSALRMFGLMMCNWWQAMRAFQQAGLRPDIKALDWFQGEQDATNQADAEAYSANGVIFFNELEKELGLGTGLKKLISRIHINGSETYESTLRAQQAILVASLSNAQLIDTDSFATRAGDGVHLSITGQLAQGAYLATLI